MPRRTDGDKIDELQQFAATAQARIEGILLRLDQHDMKQERAADGFQGFRREVAVELVALKGELAALREAQARSDTAREKAAGRAWSVVPNVAGAVVNGLLAAAVAYFVARR
ncbi:MAG: hypothetical protein K2X87_26260 [Gemmataceae bacterium]|nr:hypothetical protein [Gemmataceae bacterium]